MTRLYDDAREDLRIDVALLGRHTRRAWNQLGRALDAWLWSLRDLVVVFLRLLIFLVAWAEIQIREPRRRPAEPIAMEPMPLRLCRGGKVVRR